MTVPAPLTPPDADLQDFPFMPLHVARLRDSDLAAEEHPEACWYAVLLWAASWHQIPAGSLPDSDAVLMRLVGLGRDARTWKKHREGALHGFVRCSDGRLYHEVVAEQVVASWQGKLEQRHRTECARIKKANQRNGTDHPCSDFPSFVSERHPLSVPFLSLETPSNVLGDKGGVSSGTDGDVPRETPSKRQRQGERQGQGQGDSNIVDGDDAGASASDPPPAVADPVELAAEFCRMAGVRHLEPTAIGRHVEQVREWLAAGFDPANDIVPAIRSATAAATTTIHSLKYFDGAVRQAKARKEAQDHGYGDRSSEVPANPRVRAAAQRASGSHDRS